MLYFTSEGAVSQNVFFTINLSPYQVRFFELAIVSTAFKTRLKYLSTTSTDCWEDLPKLTRDKHSWHDVMNGMTMVNLVGVMIVVGLDIVPCFTDKRRNLFLPPNPHYYCRYGYASLEYRLCEYIMSVCGIKIQFENSPGVISNNFGLRRFGCRIPQCYC